MQQETLNLIHGQSRGNTSVEKEFRSFSGDANSQVTEYSSYWKRFQLLLWHYFKISQ